MPPEKNNATIFPCEIPPIEASIPSLGIIAVMVTGNPIEKTSIGIPQRVQIYFVE